MKKIEFLKKKYPKFIYRKYSYKVSGRNLKISFLFEVPPDFKFKPQITIKNVKTLSNNVSLENLVFHLGLMEIPSYWKATCSPEIIVEPGHINEEQIKWWQDLILKGMAQFFYENRLPWQKPKIISTNSNNYAYAQLLLKDRILVPMSGGRDSIVTMEKLKNEGKEINAFLVNPTPSTKKVIKIAGIKKPMIVERKIDPKLFELNKKGYLNGHTPFTAVLSFLSVVCAVLFNYKNIAFSNEKSADEPNLKYLGKWVNHQYSKTSEFERKFKKYCKKYLVKDINYFSLLRPYTELEISKMFVKYSQYFSVFSSCNKGAKMGIKWCKNCPKCLFIYATLYPFLEKKQIIKIFGEDLFKKRELLSIMESLIGYKRPKPFECVGTKKESLIAFSMALSKIIKKRSANFSEIPFLLKYFQKILKLQKFHHQNNYAYA